MVHVSKNKKKKKKKPKKKGFRSASSNTRMITTRSSPALALVRRGNHHVDTGRFWKCCMMHAEIFVNLGERILRRGQKRHNTTKHDVSGNVEVYFLWGGGDVGKGQLLWEKLG